MLSFIKEHLAAAEAAGQAVDRKTAFDALRPLGLADFATVLWNAPLPDYPKLSSHLPPMTAANITEEWTGSSGPRLLDQSLSFAQSVALNFITLTKRPVNGARILDYGCGYGRFLRLFSYFSDDVWGVDAWESSLSHSRAAGFADRVKKIDPIPTSLPFDEPFDLMFAFSIFTHLSQATTIGALAAMRTAIAPQGVLCITIRPEEYWEGHFQRMSASSANTDHFVATHRRDGFAFFPHHGRPEDPNVHYGDTSFTLDWLQANAHGWRIAAVDRAPNDAMQRYIYLQPA